MQNTPAKRNYALDAIKVAATIAILFHHHQQVSGAVFTNHPNFWGSAHFNWALMVELFFMISGFFAYRSLLECKEPFGPYIGKKAGRLLPTAAVSACAYFALSCLYYFLNGKPWYFKYVPDFFGLIVTCLGLQRGFGFDGSKINYPAWFISVLLICYACFYLLAKLCKKKSWRLEWVMLLAVIITQNLHQRINTLPFFNSEALRGYQAFPLGVLIASFISSYRINKPIVGLCIASVASSAAFIIFAPAFIDSSAAFIFLIAPALIILAQTDTAQKLFRHSFWSHLSAISFNTYVWQSTLQVLLGLIAPGIVFSQTVGGMYLFTLFAWIVGALSHYLIERPLTKYLPIIWNHLFVRK